MKNSWQNLIEVGLLFICLADGGRDIGLFPVCVTDSDCVLVSKTQTRQNVQPDFRCFQYMCYPWNWPWNGKRPFQKCRGSIECTNMPLNSTSPSKKKKGSGVIGQDFENGVCVLHEDIENVPDGICLSRREAVKCSLHNHCEPDQKCINGYCGDPVYFRALAELPCSSDSCQQLLLGDQCCLQLSPSYNPPWHVPKPKWPNKCCSNKDGSLIIQPEDNLSEQSSLYVNKMVQAMSLAGLAGVVCNSLKAQVREQLDSCSPVNLVNQPTDPGLAWSPGRDLISEGDAVKEQMIPNTRANVVNAWIKNKMKAARISNNVRPRKGRTGPVEISETNTPRIFVVCLGILLLASIIVLILTTMVTIGQLASRHLVAKQSKRNSVVQQSSCESAIKSHSDSTVQSNADFLVEQNNVCTLPSQFRKDKAKFASVQHPYFWYSHRGSIPFADEEL